MAHYRFLKMAFVQVKWKLLYLVLFTTIQGFAQSSLCILSNNSFPTKPQIIPGFEELCEADSSDNDSFIGSFLQPGTTVCFKEFNVLHTCSNGQLTFKCNTVVDSVEWVVYNRFGDTVHHSLDSTKVWHYHQKTALSQEYVHPVGSYFFLLNWSKTLEGMKRNYKIQGSLTLIR